MEQQIVHIDLDAFFVSVERLQNSKLNKKPVIIGGVSDRGVVSSCSYEARKYGVSSGISIVLAKRLCPEAVFIRGDMDLYSRYSNVVTEIINDLSPVFEKASIDEHYIDLTGMEKFFGSLLWAKKIRKKIIQETGLISSFGLSVNKTVSKIATCESKPNGEKYVEKSLVQSFLDPLSIQKIPMLGKKNALKLIQMGVVNIKTLRQIPENIVFSVFGKNGLLFWQKANGLDKEPVIPYQEQQSISKEHTFDADTICVKNIQIQIHKIIEKLGYKLRKNQKLTGCVTVKIKYANFETYTMQKKIPYTSFDHYLLNIACNLFEKLYQKRIRIRLIGIKFSNLVQGNQPLYLFDKHQNYSVLYKCIDEIKTKHGSHVIKKAVCM